MVTTKPLSTLRMYHFDPQLGRLGYHYHSPFYCNLVKVSVRSGEILCILVDRKYLR